MRRSGFSRHGTGQDWANQRGYVLITLLLFVALLAIAALTVMQKADFQSRRDREEELIHRGVQYARAVRAFFKKNGRYPTRIEELENTNNLRFLRKRYKDPITGEDFKLLRMGDVKLTFGPGVAGATPAAAMATAGGLGPSQPASGSPGGAQSGGGDSKSGDSSGESDSGSKSGFSGPVFGGGPIVGVASRSTKESIREFNQKNHYDQWQFIYDPASDRGGLLNTPAQPPLQGTGNVVGTPGQPGTPTGVGPTVQPTPTPPPQGGNEPQN